MAGLRPGQVQIAKQPMKEPTSFTVFLSSTFVDLSEHRKKVIEGLQRLETCIYAMEYFCASKDSSRTQCLRKVHSSDLYVGIIGLRYGSIDSETGLSYTEEEYNEATKNNIPMLLFILDESKETSIRPADIDYENIDKLRQFKNRVKQSHAVDFFVSPEDLAMKVATAIMKHINDNKTLAEKHRINPEIQDAIKPTSELTAHQLLRRFNLFPERWNGIRFNATLENYDRTGIVCPPRQTEDIEPSQPDIEVAQIPWTITEGEFHFLPVFAEGDIVYRLLDIEEPALITCTLETMLFFSQQFSYHEKPDLGVKVIAVNNIKPVSKEQFSTPPVSNDIELPF